MRRSTCCSDGSDKAILRRARGIWSGLAQKRVAPVEENRRHHRSNIRGLLAIVWPGRFLMREESPTELAELARTARRVATTTCEEKARALLDGNAVDRGALEAGHEPTDPDEIMGGGKPMDPLRERRSHGSAR